MEYLSNVLPVDPKVWTLHNATMTEKLIKLEANGTASTVLSHEQVQFTPKAFKVTAKFIGEFDEFSPAAFAKLLIKDKDKKYQVFTAPLQASNKASDAYIMQAELITNVSDFNDLVFQFNAEEHVEITEWKLYPSSDIDSNTLNTIEAVLPQFLYYFNEAAITVGAIDAEITNLPFVMGAAGNLSCHLLFSYVSNAACTMTITIRVDGAAEPYTPIVVLVNEGPGFVGIPHSLLQVQPAPHLISVHVRVEANASTPEGTTPKLSIQARAIRYTCEGRGILDGASGEYPHAEVSDTYDNYPIIDIGLIMCSTTCEAVLIDIANASGAEQYLYPVTYVDAIDCTADIPAVSAKDFGVAERWIYNSSYADSIHISGDLVLNESSVTFNNGVGEGIVTYDVFYPTEEANPLVNHIKVGTAAITGLRLAFSTDGSSWYTYSTANKWQSINLTLADMSISGILPVELESMGSEVFNELFKLGGNNKLTVAVYMVSSVAQTSFTLSDIIAYYSSEEVSPTLVAPTITLAVAEDNKVRVHWQPPAGQPRAIKVYYGESKEFSQYVVSSVGATFCEVPNLTNKTRYYFAAATLYKDLESELSNIVDVVPSIPTPRILLCKASIGAITLQWQIVGAVYDSYNIYIGTSEDALELHSNTTEMQAVIDNLQNNVEYYVAVTGVKPTDESWYSEIKTARPLLPVLILSDVNAWQTTVSMHINLPEEYAEYAGYVGYRIYYGTNPYDMTDYIDTTDMNVVVSSLTPDTQYYFYATGLTDTEESTPSDVVSAATDSSFKFTTLGHTGKEKPTQEEADSTYEYTVEVTNGIQKFIVPEDGTYLITAIGAAGGKGCGLPSNAKCLGGFGAIISGEFELSANDELYLLVGQKGTDNLQTSGDGTTGAGGGMSVVATKDDTQTDMLFGTIPVRPLVVAGAGNGGGDANASGTQGDDALLDEGTDDSYLSQDLSGGGYNQYRNNQYCGKSFIAGGDAAAYTYWRAGNASYAGFGGGGSNYDDMDGGGGGGYRGGVMGSHGGSSYNAGSNQTAKLNTERTDGLIKIKKLGGTE